MRWTANPETHDSSYETWVRIPHAPPSFPVQLDSFRAYSQGLLLASLGESLVRHSFTVRTKEPADVFPRRARLGSSRDITDFA